MYRILYDIPLNNLCLWLLLLFTAWSFIRLKMHTTLIWKLFHGLALVCWLFITLYATLFSRTPGQGGINMIPFWSYRIAFTEGSYDYFQQIYLNILAFAVFGLIAGEFANSKLTKAFIVILGAILSMFVEYAQSFLDVGLTEFDDIFSNTLGAMVGVLANAASGKYITFIIQVGKTWIQHLLQFLRQHTTE